MEKLRCSTTMRLIERVDQSHSRLWTSTLNRGTNLGSQRLDPSQLLTRWLVVAGVGLILSGSIFWNPEKIRLLPCFFHELTGYPCPSCGLTRSFHAVAELNLHQAIQFHPMGIILYVFLLVFLIKAIIEIISRKAIPFHPKSRAKKIVIGSFGVIWAGWWIIKLIRF